MGLEAAYYNTLLTNPSPFINIGCGEDISISELAHLIKDIIGFKGDIVNDTSKPNGVPQKLLDVSRLKALGWNAKITLKNGLRQTYQWTLREGVF